MRAHTDPLRFDSVILRRKFAHIYPIDTLAKLIYSFEQFGVELSGHHEKRGNTMPCTRSVRRLLAAFAILSVFASIAFAQSTISGQVRDTSGAVMSGVVVEAASPALIERARSVTTNSEGRYAIVD